MPPHAGAITIIIPTFNEAESIGAVVAELPRAIVDRVIVVDGGSRDGTQACAEKAGAEVIKVGRGYGRACLAGAQAAQADDILVLMDGDGADDPAAIAAMVDAIRSGAYDFIIASRARGKREPGSMAAHQLIAGHIAGRMTKLLYGVGYTYMCAFRAIRRDTLLKLGMREMTYGWNLENADACGARRPACARSAGRLPQAARRRIQGRRLAARLAEGRLAHSHDVRARRARAGGRAHATQGTSPNLMTA